MSHRPLALILVIPVGKIIISPNIPEDTQDTFLALFEANHDSALTFSVDYPYYDYTKSYTEMGIVVSVPYDNIVPFPIGESSPTCHLDLPICTRSELQLPNDKMSSLLRAKIVIAVGLLTAALAQSVSNGVSNSGVKYAHLRVIQRTNSFGSKMHRS